MPTCPTPTELKLRDTVCWLWLIPWKSASYLETPGFTRVTRHQSLGDYLLGRIYCIPQEVTAQNILGGRRLGLERNLGKGHSILSVSNRAAGVSWERAVHSSNCANMGPMSVFQLSLSFEQECS
jgi:hypothetical protein